MVSGLYVLNVQVDCAISIRYCEEILLFCIDSRCDGAPSFNSGERDHDNAFATLAFQLDPLPANLGNELSAFAPSFVATSGCRGQSFCRKHGVRSLLQMKLRTIINILIRRALSRGLPGAVLGMLGTEPQRREVA